LKPLSFALPKSFGREMRHMTSLIFNKDSKLSTCVQPIILQHFHLIHRHKWGRNYILV